jgi:hypothetical protein
MEDEFMTILEDDSAENVAKAPSFHKGGQKEREYPSCQLAFLRFSDVLPRRQLWREYLYLAGCGTRFYKQADANYKRSKIQRWRLCVVETLL